MVLLGGCTTTPEPICDREAVAWDKWGTTSLAPECSPRPKARPVPVYIPGLGDDDPVDPMMPPSDPPSGSQPPASKPETSRVGNPGNDKDVGKAGEKPEKGMAEQGGVKGNRGKSN